MKPASSHQDAAILAVRIRAELADIEQVVEHIFNLQPARLRVLVEALPPCYEALIQDLRRFCDCLEALKDAE